MISHSRMSDHKVIVYMHAQSCLTFYDLWTVAHQPPLSMGFSRQEYWSGLLFPSLGNLPDPGIKLRSLTSPALAGGFFTLRHLGNPRLPVAQI